MRLLALPAELYPHIQYSVVYGGDKRDRTADLLNAIQALSQLSYTPILSCCSRLIAGTSKTIPCDSSFVNRFFAILEKFLNNTRKEAIRGW